MSEVEKGSPEETFVTFFVPAYSKHCGLLRSIFFSWVSFWITLSPSVSSNLTPIDPGARPPKAIMNIKTESGSFVFCRISLVKRNPES